MSSVEFYVSAIMISFDCVIHHCCVWLDANMLDSF